ncbi:Spt2p NDAI_0C06050 [Naumovozyma dairenensis CBS 421]|uniref:Uncharacterized protein n=1 Tax=Naumovozyma dairenensis (strain ATCC 10597 / BCRC 20456 / CBS 421 / NBRC 0211 / NRRL Y-12639) TaxID=1071378 RepID=G0W903_NAUDC|nr:hypothetical protein NDAI_0C06050 [Naumovozyma dairenensis CBS 421]CCD24264.1 hypothetical protein NDAI_0C06050 [Naumovozyma dairenensis CBS 421]
MSFLSKLSALKKSTPPGTSPSSKKEALPQNTLAEHISLLPQNYTRDDDPAVRRLKELRRQERLKNGELEKKKPKPRRSPGSSSGSKSTRKRDNDDVEGSLGTVYKKKVGSSNAKLVPVRSLTKKLEPIKKLSFEELMKQAESNSKGGSPDNTAVKVTASIKKTRPPPRISKPGFKSFKERKTTASKSTSTVNNKSKPEFSRNHPNGRHLKEQSAVKLKIPKNIVAQPNRMIKQKLESKRRTLESKYSNRRGRYEDQYDDDMDDFIEDDEEEEEENYRSKSRRDERPWL